MRNSGDLLPFFRQQNSGDLMPFFRQRRSDVCVNFRGAQDVCTLIGLPSTAQISESLSRYHMDRTFPYIDIKSINSTLLFMMCTITHALCAKRQVKS